MPWYLVMLEGGPVALSETRQGMEKSVRWAGFVTTRKAFAMSASDAVARAIEDAVRELRETSLAENAQTLRCGASEVRCLTWIEAVRRRYRGFTFYPWPES
jgi:hypothetical protein